MRTHPTHLVCLRHCAIGIHLTLNLNPNPNPNPIGSCTVYVWNNRRNVFLWRPVNYTLPSVANIFSHVTRTRWDRDRHCRCSTFSSPTCERRHWITSIPIPCKLCFHAGRSVSMSPSAQSHFSICLMSFRLRMRLGLGLMLGLGLGTRQNGILAIRGYFSQWRWCISLVMNVTLRLNHRRML